MAGCEKSVTTPNAFTGVTAAGQDAGHRVTVDHRLRNTGNRGRIAGLFFTTRCARQGIATRVAPCIVQSRMAQLQTRFE